MPLGVENGASGTTVFSEPQKLSVRLHRAASLAATDVFVASMLAARLETAAGLSPADVPALAPALAAPVVAAAAVRLSAASPPAVAATLRRVLGRQAGSPAVLAALDQGLRSPHVRDRLAVVRILVWGVSLPPARMRLQIALSDPSPVVRLAAVRGLRSEAGRDDIADAVAQRLTDPVAEVRAAAVRVLGGKGASYLPSIELSRLLWEGTPAEAAAAAFHLARGGGGAEGTADLLQVARSRREPERRAAAVSALGRLWRTSGCTTAAAAVAAATSDAEPFVRAAAVAAWAADGDAFQRMFQRAVEDETPDVRAAAWRAAFRFGVATAAAGVALCARLGLPWSPEEGRAVNRLGRRLSSSGAAEAVWARFQSLPGEAARSALLGELFGGAATEPATVVLARRLTVSAEVSEAEAKALWRHVVQSRFASSLTARRLHQLTVCAVAGRDAPGVSDAAAGMAFLRWASGASSGELSWATEGSFGEAWSLGPRGARLGVAARIFPAPSGSGTPGVPFNGFEEDGFRF